MRQIKAAPLGRDLIVLESALQERAMNFQISTADRATHLKIVAVALLWSIAVASTTIFLH